MNKNKHKINEFVNDSNSLINGDIPKNDTNTSASNTTDRNVKISSQDHGGNFIGRYGYYFYENKDINNNKQILNFIEVLKNDIIDYFKKNNIKYLVTGLNSYYEEIKSEIENSLNENIIEEDKLLKDVQVKELYDEKYDNENLDLKKVVDIFSKLDKNDINKLINLLEIRMNNE